MSFRKRMSKRRNNLKKRHDNQIKKTNQGGGRYPTIFVKEELPEGIEFFRCKEGEHIVDIIPFEVGPDMPLGDRDLPVTEEGELDYIIDLYVHQNIGNMNKPYVCPYENFGEPCPICAYIKAQRLEKEDWQALRAKRRAIYLVWAHNDREQERKGIQIFESAYFFMEEKIDEIAKLPRGGGSINFSDYDDGKTVCWTRKGSGRENTQYVGHQLIDRKTPIPDKILEQTFSLDQVINMHPDIEEMEKSLMGTLKSRNLLEDSEEDTPFNEGTGNDVPMFDDEEEKPKPRRRKRPTSRKKRRRKK